MVLFFNVLKKVFSNCCFVIGFKLVVGLFNIKIFGFIVSILVIVIWCIWLFDNLNGECCKYFLFKLIKLSIFLVNFFVFLFEILKFFGLKVMFCFIVFLNNCVFGNWKMILIFLWIGFKFLLLVFGVIICFLIVIWFLVGFIKVFKCCNSVDLLLLVCLIIVV